MEIPGGTQGRRHRRARLGRGEDGIARSPGRRVTVGAALLQQIQAFETGVSASGDNQVVVERDAELLTRLAHLPGHLDIALGWGGITVIGMFDTVVDLVGLAEPELAEFRKTARQAALQFRTSCAFD